MQAVPSVDDPRWHQCAAGCGHLIPACTRTSDCTFRFLICLPLLLACILELLLPSAIRTLSIVDHSQVTQRIVKATTGVQIQCTCSVCALGNSSIGCYFSASWLQIMVMHVHVYVYFDETISIKAHVTVSCTSL